MGFGTPAQTSTSLAAQGISPSSLSGMNFGINSEQLAANLAQNTVTAPPPGASTGSAIDPPAPSAPPPPVLPRDTATDTQSGLLKPLTGYTPTTAATATYGAPATAATATYGAPATAKTTVMNPKDVSYATAAKAAAAKGKAYTYEAYLQDVRSNDLTSTHLQRLLDGNSDYIKRAKTEGLQQSNARGLLNTTMAAGAAHGAAIDRAMPIASQDAGTYNQRALAHIGEENSARRTNATNKTNVSVSNAANQTNVNMANARAETEASQYNAGQMNSFWKQYIDNENQASQFNAGQANAVGMYNAGQSNQTAQFNAGQENAVGMYNTGQSNQTNQFNATQANVAEQNRIKENLTIWENERARDHEVVTARLEQSLSLGVIDREVASNLRGQYLADTTRITENYAAELSKIAQNAAMWSAVDEKTGVTAGQAFTNNILGYWVDADGKQYSSQQPGTTKVAGRKEADITQMNAIYESMPMWNYNFNNADFPASGA